MFDLIHSHIFMNHWILTALFLPLSGATTRVVFIHASLYCVDVVCIGRSIRYLFAIWHFQSFDKLFRGKSSLRAPNLCLS